MIAALFVAHALAAEPELPQQAPGVQTELRRNGRRTLVTGGLLVAGAVPAGLLVTVATLPSCTPGQRHCFAPMLFGGFTTFGLSVGGAVTAGVGGTMLIVDGVQRRRDDRVVLELGVAPAPNGLVLSGRF